MENTPFTAYDMALLYNSRLFSEKINYTLGLDINGKPLLEKVNNKINPCSALTLKEEEEKDIEQSKILIVKLQNLLDSTIDIIIERLNKDLIEDKFLYFKETSYYYDELNKNIASEKLIYCGNYIGMNDIKKNICVGFFPTVFNENTNPKEVSDYFLSVAINKDFAKEIDDNVFPLYGKGLINYKEKDWVFFPICRKTLCVENYKECFSNKVAYIIKECFAG